MFFVTRIQKQTQKNLYNFSTVENFSLCVNFYFLVFHMKCGISNGILRKWVAMFSDNVRCFYLIEWIWFGHTKFMVLPFGEWVDRWAIFEWNFDSLSEFYWIFSSKLPVILSKFKRKSVFKHWNPVFSHQNWVFPHQNWVFPKQSWDFCFKNNVNGGKSCFLYQTS